MKKIISILPVGILISIASFGFMQVSIPGTEFCCDNGPTQPGWAGFCDENEDFALAEAFGGFDDASWPDKFISASKCKWLWEVDNFYNCTNCQMYINASPAYAAGWDCWYGSRTNYTTCGWYLPRKGVPSAPSINNYSPTALSWSSVNYANKYRVMRSIDDPNNFQTLTTTTSTSWSGTTTYSNYVIFRVYAINEDESNGNAEILSDPTTVQYNHPCIYADDISISSGSSSGSTQVLNGGNGGNDAFTWEAHHNESWITDLTQNGNIGNSASVTINRNLITTVGPGATHTGSITLESSELGSSYDKNVNVHVALITPAAPTGLTITNPGSFGQPPSLSWNPVAMVYEYLIYKNYNGGGWSQTGSTSSTSYTDNNFTIDKDGDVIYYYVKASNAAGTSSASNTVSILASIAMITRPDGSDLQISLPTALPEEYGLMNCYPNPANPGTTIKFQLPEASEVDLRVINVNGQTIKQMVSGSKSAGFHEVYWDGTNNHHESVVTGMYIFVLRAGGNVYTKKFSLVK